MELSDKHDELTLRDKVRIQWALIYTTDNNRIIRRPAWHIWDALAREIEWMTTTQCQLVDRTLLQRVVGRLTFCARFVKFGRYHINSSYVLLAGVIHLKCHADIAMISAEMATNIEHLAAKLLMERWEPLVAYPKFQFPGVQTLTSDTVASIAGVGYTHVWHNRHRHMDVCKNTHT